MKNLQNIFEAITPDNIKDIQVIKDSMAIFVETLDELAAESADITKAFQNTNIREEIIKIYLDDLYTVLVNLQFNKKIVDYIDNTNDLYGTEYYKGNIIYNIVKFINDEHFFTIRSYKERKGTKAAIQYMYDLISTFVNVSDETPYPFTLVENGSFNFNVRGGMPSIFYENIVRPLAHPLGFTYQYSTILQLLLEDYYSSDGTITYNTSELYVKSFFSDGTTSEVDYLNYSGGTRTVVSVSSTTENNARIKTVVFADGETGTNYNHTYLKQVTTTTGSVVYYMQSVNGGTDTILETYAQQSVIYHAYTLEVPNTLPETIDFTDNVIKSDHWARLSTSNLFYPIGSNKYDPQTGEVSPVLIGEFYVGSGGISFFDVGFNSTMDQDNNVTTNVGRNEHYYAPSGKADLAVLQGKYTYIFDQQSGVNYVKRSVVTETVQSPVVVDNTISEYDYYLQNVENSEYHAKEMFKFQEQRDLDEPETHVEMVTDAIWFQTIGQGFNIGDDAYISYKAVEVQTSGESYVELSKFNAKSDDNFGFGVYRSGSLLADNNYSAWAA